MAVTTRLTLETTDFSNREEVHAFIDQIIAAGMLTVRENVGKLQAMGLMDSEGKSLSDERPPDMQEGSERDFGG